MSVITNNLLLGDEGYFLTKSLRFRSSATAYLSRTFTTSTNNKIWTYSAWIKLSDITGNPAIMGTTDDNTANGNFGVIRFSAGQIQIVDYAGGYRMQLSTTARYRDPAAWYHVVIAVDTTQATSTNRVKLYINGTQVTAFSTSTYPSQNLNTFINSAAANYLCAYYTSGVGASSPFEGYVAELHFIDGQQLTPSSFGETDTKTGVWIPKKYIGTYGNNGAYLDFKDTSSVAALGYDAAGSNDWTVNNISLTSGSTYDSMKDVPTLTDTDTANYCVLNPLTNGSFTTLSNANLTATGNTATNNGNTRGTIPFITGKWYCEMIVGNWATTTYPSIGIILTANAGVPDNTGTNQVGYPSNSVAYENNGNKRIANSTSAYGNSFTTNDIIGVAVDADNGAIYFSKNGTWQNSGVPTSGSSKTGSAFNWTGGSLEYVIATAQYNASVGHFNFGQRPFAYTPPTGFKALNTFNLPTPTIGATASTQAGKYFNPVLYTGNGSSLSVTGVGFQPDLVWTKARSTAYNHSLVDAVRGISKSIQSNLTNAEDNASGSYVTAFNSDGFTVGTGTASNNNGSTYVAWNWKANGSGSSNTAGTITSTVSANTTAGFSIVTYTGNGSGGATVGHGLGVAPKMIIVKRRDSGVGATNWYVYNANLNNGVNPAQYYIFLNLTNAQGGASSVWNDTAPTSSVFSLGTSSETNGSGGTFVAYCFAQVAGYSAFGSYTGNGSTNGTFVYTGFRPRYLLIKKTSAAQDWYVYDTARDSYNEATKTLFPNGSFAEESTRPMDFLSNGFKLRVASNTNDSGATYIYMAFAENPFKFSNAR